MDDTEKRFGENNHGVHLMNGEFTLCGYSFDCASTEGEDFGDVAKTKKRVVTCPDCIRVIDMVRGVRTKKEG